MTVSNPKPGTVLGGKYSVIRQLGEGGMGAVFEAEHTITHKRVAIKWMHPRVAASPDSARRMVREAQASALVRHPNVVDVFDVVQDGETIFLVMELLEGEPLSTFLDRGTNSLPEVIAMLLPAMRGVDAAHAQGVIHRDIKPDNIFLARVADTAQPVPKVLDFGISKIMGADQAAMTRTGTSMGTPLYMSFEQLCGEKNIDGRTDIYAFGVILYEAATGQPPFIASTFPELAVKIATTDPPRPKSLRPDLPLALDRLIMWAMAKKREDRLSTLKELIRELEAFASERTFRAQMTSMDDALPRVGRASQRADADLAQASSAQVEEAPDTLEPRTVISHAPSAPEIYRVKRSIGPSIVVGVGFSLLVLLIAWWTFTLTQPEQTPASASPLRVEPMPAPDPQPAPEPEPERKTPQPTHKHDSAGVKPPERVPVVEPKKREPPKIRAEPTPPPPPPPVNQVTPPAKTVPPKQNENFASELGF